MKHVLLTVLLLVSAGALAHEPGDHLPPLTPEESATLRGMLYTANNLSAVHITEGFLPPYICSFSWNITLDWIPVVEWDVRHHLAHTSPKDRRSYPFEFYAWWIMLDRLGCGDWDPPFGDWKPDE